MCIADVYPTHYPYCAARRIVRQYYMLTYLFLTVPLQGAHPCIHLMWRPNFHMSHRRPLSSTLNGWTISTIVNISYYCHRPIYAPDHDPQPSCNNHPRDFVSYHTWHHLQYASSRLQLARHHSAATARTLHSKHDQYTLPMYEGTPHDYFYPHRCAAQLFPRLHTLLPTTPRVQPFTPGRQLPPSRLPTCTRIPPSRLLSHSQYHRPLHHTCNYDQVYPLVIYTTRPRVPDLPRCPHLPAYSRNRTSTTMGTTLAE